MDADLVAMFEELLDAARGGDLTAAFIVYQRDDESYDACYQTEDLGDLLLQVRTEVIRAQIDTAAADQRLN